MSTLKRALTEMFEHADKDGSGFLSYKEFADAFKTLSYGLTDNDIKTLIALADDNADEKITWEEFIPHAIDSIKTFFARNKVLQKMKEKEREIKREAIQMIYQDEIGKCVSIMNRKFRAHDEKNTGIVTLHKLRIAMTHCALLTPKEINLIMRSFRPEQTAFEYKEFGGILFDVRYELAKSRLMDTGLDKLTENLIHEFAVYDTAKKGTISITDVKKALFNSKHTSLTPFQVFTLIGMSHPDQDGQVNYVEFAKSSKQMIDELFSMKSITEKAVMIENHQYVSKPNLEEINITSLELFQLFKKYDRNQNGFLEINEYIECLKGSQVNLTEYEIVTLGLAADVNGDERIDYEEFMKHFQDCLKMVRFQGDL